MVRGGTIGAVIVLITASFLKDAKAYLEES